jgi:TatD DNase family protein
MLVDSHCHLDMLAEKEDLKNIVERARKNGIEYLQTICTKLEDLPILIKITEEFERVYASVGIHPCDVRELIGSETLIELSKHDKIIGLGETGLDYYHKNTDKDLQIKCFIEHIKASQNTQLPVIIHTREAEADTIDILKSEMGNENFPALIHCFTSNIDFARQVLDLGLYISIAGIVTFKNAESLKEVARFVPLDRLLVETDAPYLTPVPFRGKQNEPAYVKQVAQYIADLKQLSFDQVALATTNNFFELFSKCKRNQV